MPLNIYYSDRIKDLAARLTERLLDERSPRDADPFVLSQVVVPNTNIAKWLRIRMFADAPSLCMGVEFPFIENRLFEILAGCLPADARPQPLPDDAYTVGILSILLKDPDPLLAPFRRYVSGGESGPLAVDSRERARMAWQLSSKLADLMDKYEVHRQPIVDNWLAGRGATGGPLAPGSVEAAEAALARKLFGRDGLYRPAGPFLSLRQLFEKVCKEQDRPAGPPRTIHFFGLSVLSSLQARILHWLARTHEIAFYHNNVCLEFWGDIETKHEASVKERLLEARGAEADRDLYGVDEALADAESSLLRQWGRAGRETLRLLVDLEEQNATERAPVALAIEELPSGAGAGTTMLEKVQSSVRNRMDRVGRVAGQDATIQVVAAPGIRREVETVYNAILGAVWPKDAPGRPWGACRFSDIAVLVPDMATYRPVVEAVFDARGQIPYGLIDTTASEDSSYLQGFLALVALARDGLTRETLFAVLDNPCVQRALSFGPDDVADWRDYAKGCGAFDDFDGKDQAANFSWDPALRRLRLGRVAKGGDGLVVWDGGDDASSLRFSAVVETLHRELSGLARRKLRCAKPPSERDEDGGEPTWSGELRRIANAFLEIERDDKLEGPVKGRLFGTLASLAAVEGPQGLDLVVAAVEAAVGGVPCRKGGYLTDGVTIAGLQPMRPVPFKQVFVLGMGEGRFPGRDSATTLEIPGARRTLGDMQPTAMKKYLFLETLMAVQDRLVVSYPCLDPAKDAELFPSGMVCELEAFLKDHVLPIRGTDEEGNGIRTDFEEVRLPLLERGEPDDFAHPDPADDIRENPVGPIAWSDVWYAGLIPTYSDDERRLARRLAGDPATAAPEAPAGRQAPAPDERIALRSLELARFLDSPLRSVLRYRHGIGVEGYKDGSIDPDAPLELEDKGPVRWRFERALLEATSAEAAPDVEGVYAPFADRGELPEGDGFLGRYSVDDVSAKIGDGSTIRGLRAFVDGFLPADGKTPDPVRTVLGAPAGTAEDAGAPPPPERLFTGQTKDWKISKDDRASSVLLFNRCGDSRNKQGDISETPFPPKAVLEPFVAWIAMVAGAKDNEKRSLRVGIADVGELLYNAWTWTTTPGKARAWLDALSEDYLRFLERPDEDGSYLDFGYSEFAKALARARSKAMEKGLNVQDFPQIEEDWAIVAESFLSFGGRRDGGGFDNRLVVDRSVGPLGRSPGEGDDEAVDRDARTLRDRYERWFQPILDGVRSRTEA